MERKKYLDILRVFATIAVVICHVSAQNYYNIKINSNAFFVFSVANGINRWCVPIFLMISGTLFLGREIPVKVIYKKYVSRLAVAFCVWSCIYAIWGYINGAGIGQTMGQFFVGHYHLWYLYMIVGLYALIPIINAAISELAIEKYILLVSFWFGIFFPSVNYILELRIEVLHTWLDIILGNINMQLANCFVFYFVLGHYLHRIEISKTIRVLLYILTGLCMIIGICLTIDTSMKLEEVYMQFYDNNSLLVMLESIGVFVFFKSGSSYLLNSKTENLFYKLSKMTFGVYLVHPLAIDLAKLAGLNTLAYSPIVSICLVSVIVVIASFTLAWIFNQIPILKKICS